MIWAPVMFRGEREMLAMRLEAFAGTDVCHVIVEGTHTHRGVPREITFQRDDYAPAPMFNRIVDLSAPMSPWQREHYQRAFAWPVIDAEGVDDDIVIIGDLDEIPSPVLLKWAHAAFIVGGESVRSVMMRTFLFAVDWEVAEQLPPTCVVASVGYLREQYVRGYRLGDVRDGRDYYGRLYDGGWHFSWVGGPEFQRAKLLTATCHTEILQTPEADLILSGSRWRSQESGGGLAVRPVDVDDTWPAYIHERRCPPQWFRPRELESA